MKSVNCLSVDSELYINTATLLKLLFSMFFIGFRSLGRISGPLLSLISHQHINHSTSLLEQMSVSEVPGYNLLSIFGGVKEGRKEQSMAPDCEVGRRLTNTLVYVQKTTINYIFYES